MPARLTRFREKVTLLERIGIDRMIWLPFNEQVSQITATSVIEDFLVGQLGVRYVVVGDDFRFGRGREGDYAMLKRGGDRFGFDVSHIGTLTFDHQRVSSSRIREALAAGDIRLAEKLLGHELLHHGSRRVWSAARPSARRADREYPAESLSSACRRRVRRAVTGLDRTYDGIANVGVRPTIGGKEPLLEVHCSTSAAISTGRSLTVTFGTSCAKSASSHRSMR